jgi:hypothetical protein
MLDGLAFLPVSYVLLGIEFLRSNVPEGLKELFDYLIGHMYQEYMEGCESCSWVVSLDFWNVHDATLMGTERKNTFVNLGAIN